jgi:cell division protein FtsZ
VKTIMSGMGVAMMGTGSAEGDGRAMTAAQKAISSPLLEDSSVNGARGVIINVTGGPDMSLMEVNEASSIIQESAHEDANIIFGAVIDPNLQGKVKITVIATGFERKGSSRSIPAAATQTPVDLHNYTAHLAANRAAAEAVEQAHQQQAVNQHPQHSYVPPPVTVSRRPGIDLTLPANSSGPMTGAAAGAVSGAKSQEAADAELHSRFDVPAFLRRQS